MTLAEIWQSVSWITGTWWVFSMGLFIDKTMSETEICWSLDYIPTILQQWVQVVGWSTGCMSMNWAKIWGKFHCEVCEMDSQNNCKWIWQRPLTEGSGIRVSDLKTISVSTVLPIRSIPATMGPRSLNSGWRADHVIQFWCQMSKAN